MGDNTFRELLLEVLAEQVVPVYEDDSTGDIMPVREAINADLRERVNAALDPPSAQHLLLKDVLEHLAAMDVDGKRIVYIQAPEDVVVGALCEQVGYGAVMDAAARLWFKKDSHGAFLVGPPAILARNLREKIVAALKEVP
jgi:hypothetical protein